jgi:hypothetical protein
MQWFQNIRWSKRVTTWDEFVRILHTRYSVPEKVEEHDNFKNEDEEKEDDAATQTISPESVPDPIKDIEYTKIILEISESALDQKLQIPTINSILEKIESLDQVKARVADQSDDEIHTDGDRIRTIISDPVATTCHEKGEEEKKDGEAINIVGEAYHLRDEIPQLKESESLLGKPFPILVDGDINEQHIFDERPGKLELAVRKHRWRWKQGEEEKDARCLLTWAKTSSRMA